MDADGEGPGTAREVRYSGWGDAIQVGRNGEVYEESGARDGRAGWDDLTVEGGAEGEAVGRRDQDVCGDDPEIEGESWSSRSTYYGHRVGGKSSGNCQGGGPSAKTATLTFRRETHSLRPT